MTKTEGLTAAEAEAWLKGDPDRRAFDDSGALWRFYAHHFEHKGETWFPDDARDFGRCGPFRIAGAPMQKTTLSHLEAGAYCFANPGVELVRRSNELTGTTGARVRVSKYGHPQMFDGKDWLDCSYAFSEPAAPFTLPAPEAELPELPGEIEAFLDDEYKWSTAGDRNRAKDYAALILKHARKP